MNTNTYNNNMETNAAEFIHLDEYCKTSVIENRITSWLRSGMYKDHKRYVMDAKITRTPVFKTANGTFIHRVMLSSYIIFASPQTMVDISLGMNDVLLTPRINTPSISGMNYETIVYETVKNCYYNGSKFVTSDKLGGSTANIDLICCNKIGVEIKKCNAPDWGQSKLTHVDGKWISCGSKLSTICKDLFNAVLDDIKLFEGDIPPFITGKITHSEWASLKKITHKYDDKYIQCDDDSISRMYAAKGCRYIQISDYGLYKTTDDACEFNVPVFRCAQRLRIRIKVHQYTQLY